MIPSVALEGRSRTVRANRAGVRKTHDCTAIDLPPKCSQKRLLIDESTAPTRIRRIDAAERDAIRVGPRSQFRNSTPVACDEQQHGSLSQSCLRKKDDTFVVSSEHIQGKDDLINRKNLERSSGNGGPDDDVKRSTQAIRKETLRGKGDRETPHSKGTGTKTKIDTFPLPGNNRRSFLYSDTATTGAAADVRVL